MIKNVTKIMKNVINEKAIQLHMNSISSNNIRHPVTKTFTPLHYTSPNYTSPHFTTIVNTSFPHIETSPNTLHYTC